MAVPVATKFATVEVVPQKSWSDAVGAAGMALMVAITAVLAVLAQVPSMASA